MKRFNKVLIAGSLAFTAIFSACSKTEELDESQIDAIRSNAGSEFDLKTTYKPFKDQEFKAGKVGGVWNDTLLNDPKTFNMLIAERDNVSHALVGYTVDYLVDYNPTKREWSPRGASFEIETDESKGTLTVHFTIRDDMYWTWYGKDEKIPVTSDDICFWFNTVYKQVEFQSNGYGTKVVEMEDGSEKEILCNKIDDKHFDFVYPRIIAEPLLSSNMMFAPAFIYEKAYKEGGVEAVKALFSIDTDPKTIPSCGKFYITEYTPGQRLVFTRNDNYWEKDANGVSIPYYDQKILSIVGDQNTDYLLFKQGKTEAITARPEEVSDLVDNQKDDYTVFRADGALSTNFWSFNQNPQNKDKPYYKWFTQTKFRQAMSCLTNRDRMITQSYRGLADPKLDFFPECNPYYNEDIKLQYLYDLNRAEKLLGECEIKKAEDGFMYDEDGNKIEFDLLISAGATVANDMALIVADEAAKIGVTINVRQLDFNKVVEMLTATYDWESLFIGLGVALFPTQGSNVWPSYGNLHLWYPLQETPATEWEARIDQLFNEGSYTADRAKAKVIWDEYQATLLEQCPVIYLVRSKSFTAVRNTWNMDNVYYDNLNELEVTHIFKN